MAMLDAVIVPLSMFVFSPGLKNTAGIRSKFRSSHLWAKKAEAPIGGRFYCYV